MKQNQWTRCAQTLRVLADGTRLGVVSHLARGPLHVGELMMRLDVEQSLLSHHLRVLRSAGIVVSERDGKSVLYRLGQAVQIDKDQSVVNLGSCSLKFFV